MTNEESKAETRSENETNTTRTIPTADKDDRNWAMYCHLASLSALIGLPFGQIIGPLIIWLAKRDTMPVVDAHGKESLNFQITMSIAIGVVSFLAVIFSLLALIPLIGCLMIPLVIVAIVIIDVVFVIQATIAANRGELMLYPYTWRVIE